MRQHHTKTKGDLGVLKAQLELYNQGFSTFTSVSEHEEFDLVAYKDQRFYRIQVKYRTVRDGKLYTALSTSWADKNGNHRSEYDKGELDVLAVYCPDTDEMYFISVDDIDGTSIVIRTEPTKNNQAKGIRMASEFLIFPE